MKHFEITTVSGDVIRAMKIYGWKSDEGREAIADVRIVQKRPDPRDWTGDGGRE